MCVTNTVLNECAYLCRNSADWKQLYIKYDACIGDVVNAWTIYSSFWATVCKMVRPMLSDHCLCVCLSCLSVTFVHCGQTVGRIKMKLGKRVGLDPGHFV